MANVLVIKNADFAANRVAVITFDGKPCTGIELSETEITVTSLQPTTVEYTVTPADTTDPITWQSSDTSVATVLGNVVTVVGIGTTTITAHCGSHSASLTLTADLYETLDWYGAVAFDVTSKSGNTTVSVKTVDSETAYGRLFAGRSKDNSTYPYKPLDSRDYTADDGIRPIKIPNNVNKIHLSANGSDLYPAGTGYAGIAFLFASGNESVNWAETYTVVKGISASYVSVTSGSANGSVEIPNGADSYFLGVRLRNNAAAGSDPATIANTNNIVIHYLPEEEE